MMVFCGLLLLFPCCGKKTYFIYEFFIICGILVKMMKNFRFRLFSLLVEEFFSLRGNWIIRQLILRILNELQFLDTIFIYVGSNSTLINLNSKQTKKKLFATLKSDSTQRLINFSLDIKLIFFTNYTFCACTGVSIM